jgi:hypothetical protein
MSMTDMEDQNDFLPTLFDKERILALEIGDDMEAECGAWKVLRYKDEYLALLNVPPKFKLVAQKSMPTPEGIIEFLEDAFKNLKLP